MTVAKITDKPHLSRVQYTNSEVMTSVNWFMYKVIILQASRNYALTLHVLTLLHIKAKKSVIVKDSNASQNRSLSMCFEMNMSDIYQSKSREKVIKVN